MIGHLLGAAGAVEAIAVIQVSWNTNLTVKRPTKSTILYLFVHIMTMYSNSFSWFRSLKLFLAATLWDPMVTITTSDEHCGQVVHSSFYCTLYCSTISGYPVKTRPRNKFYTRMCPPQTLFLIFMTLVSGYQNWLGTPNNQPWKSRKWSGENHCITLLPLEGQSLCFQPENLQLFL